MSRSLGLGLGLGLRRPGTHHPAPGSLVPGPPARPGVVGDRPHWSEAQQVLRQRIVGRIWGGTRGKILFNICDFKGETVFGFGGIVCFVADNLQRAGSRWREERPGDCPAG